MVKILTFILQTCIFVCLIITTTEASWNFDFIHNIFENYLRYPKDQIIDKVMYLTKQ